MNKNNVSRGFRKLPPNNLIIWLSWKKSNSSKYIVSLLKVQRGSVDSLQTALDSMDYFKIISKNHIHYTWSVDLKLDNSSKVM